MRIGLGRQLGRNAEAYVDDIVVKSQEVGTLIADLEEMFASLCKVDLWLNPKKFWASWCHIEGSRPIQRRSRQ